MIPAGRLRDANIAPRLHAPFRMGYYVGSC